MNKFGEVLFYLQYIIFFCAILIRIFFHETVLMLKLDFILFFVLYSMGMTSILSTIVIIFCNDEDNKK